MKRPDITLVLDEALEKLQKGMPLDQVLAEYSEYAAELTPLLKAAQKFCPSTQPTVPPGALAHSRTRFLQAANAQTAKPLPPFARFRLATNLIAVVLVIMSALFFTGIGTVSALPGQALYTVKLAVEQAQLAMTSNLSDKLLLEERFDRRRAKEVLQLIEHGRSQQVSFAGFLSANDGNPCTVEGVSLLIDESLLAAVKDLAGSYVEVSGQVEPGENGVSVSALQLHLFHLSGELTQHQGDYWLVDGVSFQIDQRTQMDRPLAIGQKAEITAIRPSQQEYLALSVHLEGEPEVEETVLIATDASEDDDSFITTPEPEISDDETDVEDQAETPDDEIWYHETDDDSQPETPEAEITDSEMPVEEEPESTNAPDSTHDDEESSDDTEEDLSSEAD